jgi:hypothetical protein
VDHEGYSIFENPPLDELASEDDRSGDGQNRVLQACPEAV